MIDQNINNKSASNDVISRFKERHMVDEKMNIKKIEEYLKQKENLNEEGLSVVNKIAELEKIYNKFKKELSQSRRQQLNRIGREFLVNDYARRYNVSQEVIVSAIAGEDNANSELLRQTREQKVKIFK